MKIVKLHISNFLKLRDVELNPSKTNVIVGKNKQGKTSILKAIQAAFEGKLDSSAIRIGADKAEITIELDEMIIKRTVTPRTTSLDISNEQGMKYPAPQKVLDGLIGTFSFNPVAFFEMKPAEQKQYLLEAVQMKLTPEELAPYLMPGEMLPELDYSKHALEVVADARKIYYDRRTAANAEVSKKRKTLDELRGSIPQGFNPRDVSEEHIASLRAAIEKDKVEREKEKAALKEYADLAKDVEDIEEQIRVLTEKRDQKTARMAELKEMKWDTSDDTTIAAAEESLRNLESQREILFTVKRADEVEKELSTAVGEQEKLDAVVKRLTKDVPQALIQKASLPVEGLAVTEDGITINGVALENLSGAEQLKFALAVVRELNKEFRIICIDGIERLDSETFETFLKEVESDDYQYFVSRVDGAEAEKKGYILVEDGMVTDYAHANKESSSEEAQQ
jgi:predicted ATP-dependent endonuclease of OLD family